MNKEQIGHSGEEEWGQVEHIHDHVEMDGELEGYIERVEKAGELHQQQAPMDDQGQPLVQHSDPVALPNDAVVLPLTQEEFESGMQENLFTSARWLAEWCLLMIKKYGRRVFFKA